jgi:hypothetical protein
MRISKKTRRDILLKALATGMFFGVLLGVAWNVAEARREMIDPTELSGVLKLKEYTTTKYNPEQIIEIFFGEKADQAKEVAKCESGLYPGAKSSKSTAKGLFQIIDGTWRAYKCDGNPLNSADNARCAKKIYDKNQRWDTGGGWKASYWCHKQV